MNYRDELSDLRVLESYLNYRDILGSDEYYGSATEGFGDFINKAKKLFERIIAAIKNFFVKLFSKSDAILMHEAAVKDIKFVTGEVAAGAKLIEKEINTMSIYEAEVGLSIRSNLELLTESLDRRVTHLTDIITMRNDKRNYVKFTEYDVDKCVRQIESIKDRALKFNPKSQDEVSIRLKNKYVDNMIKLCTKGAEFIMKIAAAGRYGASTTKSENAMNKANMGFQKGEPEVDSIPERIQFITDEIHKVNNTPGYTTVDMLSNIKSKAASSWKSSEDDLNKFDEMIDSERKRLGIN